jgi:hypothetical protein
MKLIRLPSGTLACVFPLEVETQRGSRRGEISDVYRAFSGSVEADGTSEDQAIQALDAEVRRLSEPPAADIEEFELLRDAANDVAPWDNSRSAEATGLYPRYSEHPTIPVPASSSRR